LVLLRTALARLAKETPVGEADNEVQRGLKIERILRAYRNGTIADLLLGLSGCTKGNAVPESLGARPFAGNLEGLEIRGDEDDVGPIVPYPIYLPIVPYPIHRLP
jgi:hypothetical protein